MNFSILATLYIISSVTFIVGLKLLSHPESARKGNRIAALGMALAILGTIFLYQDPVTGETLHNYGWIFGGLLVGSVIGVAAAKKVKMTAMPEMVSIFNGMGGACAALISLSEFGNYAQNNFLIRIAEAYGPGSQVDSEVLALPVRNGSLITIFLGLIIGSVSFAGSVVAWAKLNGRMKDYTFRGQQVMSVGMLLLIVGVSIFALIKCQPVVFAPTENGSLFINKHISIGLVRALFYLVFALSLLYGIFFVMPIGGADMPVVISLLNSFTGVAAACGGFLYDNKVMLTGGILVGAAGTLLTILMCKAMNRSLGNVLVGAFGGSKAAAATTETGHYKEIGISDAAIALGFANKVMIVPGYGLAVAQAQHACHELEKMLTDRGVDVRYAIHPVAGRMPGHMNVLLAEADVEYEKLLEMEQANTEFETTDVVIVLGANDVVNPAAKNDPGSPIYGMPILEVEKARSVIVNKRSMKPGYAGIENELFFKARTSMLFGDAKKVLQALIAEIRNI